jgi:hypothetical protein
VSMPDTQPLTDRTLIVAQRFHRIAKNYKATLGFESVWFGDQRMLPRTPSLCVEPGRVARELYATQNRTTNEIDTTFLIYHSPVSEKQTARAEAIGLAEYFVHYMELNHLRLYAASGAQLTVHGHCMDLDPGFTYKQGTLYHAVQVNWRSITKTWLQQPWTG